MLGNIVNFFAIIVGSIFGLLVGKKISGEIQNKIMTALGLSVSMIGVQMSLKVNSIMIMILSIVIGLLIGATIKIDWRLKEFGKNLEARFVKNRDTSKPSISQAFIASSLLYCVGSMSILGALQAGLTGKYETLFAKSMLDGISAIIFSSTMGIGVMLSAISVFLYQGAITLMAVSLQGIFTEAIMSDVTGVGGLLIVAIGLNIMGIKKIEVGDYLPAIFLPILFNFIKNIIS